MTTSSSPKANAWKTVGINALIFLGVLVAYDAAIKPGWNNYIAPNLPFGKKKQ